MLRAFLVIVILFWATDHPSRAQLSPAARVSLITIAPGDAVYSLWGHSALRIYDPAQELDIAYNYGTFDFGNPVLFVARFAYGQLDYQLSVQSYPVLATASWQLQERTVTEQVLRLTSTQKDRLYQFLQTNALPHNRVYRYDFLFDNCSTRIRDVLEKVLGDSLFFATDPVPTENFRELVDPYVHRHPFIDVLIHMGMGLSVDRAITRREKMFLPEEMSRAFDEARVTVSGNSRLPLVQSTDTVYVAPLRAHMPSSWPWPSIVGWILCSMAIIAGIRQWPLPWRQVDSILFGFTGFLGLLIMVMWFISLHDVARNNVNILGAWPSHMAVLWALLRNRTYLWLRPYYRITAIAAFCFAVATLVLPPYIPGAVLPLLVLLMVRCIMRIGPLSDNK